MKHFSSTLLFLFLMSCGTEKREVVKDPGNGSKPFENQLNITILLDLSDRIDPRKNPDKPEHFERDIAIVRQFSEMFVRDMEKKGTFMSKGKIKVIFSPKPQDPNVNVFAEKLNVDLSIMDVKQKKVIHDTLVSTFHDNIAQIYNLTLKESKWIGSDIWRFFKNDVKDYCIDENPDYRNLLVILTDGYIYHKDSKEKNGNKYAYLLPDNIAQFNLRNNQNWEEELNKSQFGLIAKRSDLEDLEVLVLEIEPSAKYKGDEDILKAVLGNWLAEMKVKRFAIFNSDLPEYTKKRINNFLN